MKNAVLVAPATGLLMPITDVSDPIFAQKTMGEGFGVEPTSNQIVAPASGRIVLIADTKHAIGIRTDSGVEILIHMGIDTVELKGAPFEIDTHVDAQVNAGDIIGSMDLEAIRAAGMKTTIIVAITNTADILNSIDLHAGEVQAGNTAADLSLKTPTTKPVTNVDEKNQYAVTARDVIAAVGGPNNVKSLIHCITRLRFYLKDESVPDDGAVAEIPGVIDVARAAGQYQVVIGQTVTDVYDEAIKQLGPGFANPEATAQITAETEAAAQDQSLWGKTKRGASSLIGVITGSMIPIIGLLAASGMLKGIMTILTTWGGVSTTSQTYMLINAMGDATFYFLPVLVGFTAAQKLGSDPVIVAIIGAFLIYPSLVQVVAGGKSFGTVLGMTINSNFFGIPIHIPQYTYSIFPMIFAAWMASKVEPWIKKWMPVMLRMIFSPLVEIFLVGMTVLIVVGPIITLISTGISAALQALLNLNLALSGMIIGGLYQVLVIFGLHWAVIPIISAQLSVPGGHSVLNGIVSVTMIAQGAGALAVWVKTRNNKALSGLSLSAAISAFVGITEPAMYGINLKYGRVFMFSSIGAAIGGLLNGLLGVDMYGFTGSWIGFPSFASNANPSNLLNFFIVSTVTTIAAFTLVYLFGYKESDSLKAKTAPKKKHLGE
ncbi:glucose PTS transporter subunit IIA [Lacticaseibacillus manihotivorans]|jgi:PTS system beta-glucosides-specific IIC component|uniref:Beta-glucoside-specific PTS system IIABC component n=2 Tax=Lacticaseibacillus manihotivorans TaxID=88233 RepID=A0A0R1PZW0_9LACO|nr:glucose PTS transporter subunit IIA [Lacticaseibacillus manihotivorans]KRL37790.1 beta-glucoside-specific PTS system IIABC component [Lacticaseibacillus manihotivorans DSM 13343 = JCM 12514]QFQ91329.1 PTS beta-glucoside transporter subunit IIABC [Lacticaseibacillus manihotivorans]